MTKSRFSSPTQGPTGPPGTPGTNGTNGTNGTDGGFALTPTTVKTTNYSAAAGEFVPVDTATSGPVTITLPTAPADKTLIGIKHVIQGSTNVVTYVTGGMDVFNKAGGATSRTLTLLEQGVIYQYKASTGIWYRLANDLTLASVDGRFAVIAAAVPVGGTAAQVLRKTSSTNYDEAWATLVAADIPTLMPKAGGTFTGAVTKSMVTLTDAPTIAVDASLGNVFRVTLGGNRTMGSPTNASAAQTVLFRIRQDATGSRTLTWHSIFRFSTDIPAPTLSTTANMQDYVLCQYNDTDTKWDVLAVSPGY